jgi:hypothetical protein
MQERRLQRWMKELLAAMRLNPDNWHYIKHTPEKLVIIYKYTTQTRVINLEGRNHNG